MQLNEGKFSGVCAILSSSFEGPKLYLLCRHHIYEVHIAHIMKPIFGPPKAPSKKWYTSLHNIWPKISQEVNILENIVFSLGNRRC